MSNALNIRFDDITSRDWGQQYTDADEEPLTRLLDRVVRRLLARRRRLPEWVASGLVHRDDVIDVVASAMERVTLNPGALKSEAEGDYRYEVNQLVASGNIWFPDDELAQITPGGSTSTAIGTAHVRPSPGWRGW